MWVETDGDTFGYQGRLSGGAVTMIEIAFYMGLIAGTIEEPHIAAVVDWIKMHTVQSRAAREVEDLAAAMGIPITM